MQDDTSVAGKGPRAGKLIGCSFKSTVVSGRRPFVILRDTYNASSYSWYDLPRDGVHQVPLYPAEGLLSISSRDDQMIISL